MKFNCMVALVTPMHLDGQVDYKSLAALIEWHITAGTEAIVVLGTTGETPTLTHEEKITIIKTSIQQSNKRIPIIVGAGTYDTRTTIALSQEAEALGADGVLLINPYYNKPTQKGLFLHFKAVDDAISIPIILYNHPGRTGGSLAVETIIELSKLNHIIGLKEASTDLSRITAIRAQTDKKFLLWSACDDNTVDFIRAGGDGVISVTGNLMPKTMHQLVQLARNNDFIAANNLQKMLNSLHQATGLETNPIPIKHALYKMGKIPPGIRLPLTPLDEIFQPMLEKILIDFELLPSTAQDISL